MLVAAETLDHFLLNSNKSLSAADSRGIVNEETARGFCLMTYNQIPVTLLSWCSLEAPNLKTSNVSRVLLD